MPVCRPVCRFFLAQILTLRAHFHQILTLLSAFEFQNLGFAQILTLFGLFGGLTRTFSRNSSKSLPYSALLDFKISVLAKHRVTSLVNHLNLEMTQPTARARAPSPSPRARLPASLMDFLMYFLLPPNPERRAQSPNPSPSAAPSNGFPNVFPTASEREI